MANGVLIKYVPEISNLNGDPMYLRRNQNGPVFTSSRGEAMDFDDEQKAIVYLQQHAPTQSYEIKKIIHITPF